LPGVAADNLGSYLERRGVSGPWTLDLTMDPPFAGAVVIPSLAESASIPRLLESLSADYTLPDSGLVVVFVVNNRGDASVGEKGDNQRTLSLLREVRRGLPFPVGIIDAASDWPGSWGTTCCSPGSITTEATRLSSPWMPTRWLIRDMPEPSSPTFVLQLPGGR
jgi:hypothetical protein